MSIPSEPVAGGASGKLLGASRGCLCLSVTVLDDEACEGDEDGRGAAVLALPCSGGDAGDALSSSGFAIRSAPRLISMAAAVWGQLGDGRVNERQATGRSQRVAARSISWRRAGTGRRWEAWERPEARNRARCSYVVSSQSLLQQATNLRAAR